MEKNNPKEKSSDKIRKKNNRLSEEYFLKPAGKKKTNTHKLKTVMSSKSLKKRANIDEYLSTSKIIGGNIQCLKKSTIKSPNKMKI